VLVDALPGVPSARVVVLAGGIRPSELEDALKAILEDATPETRTVVVDSRPEESRAARAFRAAPYREGSAPRRSRRSFG
jgi:hypothetical protein